jgi:tetratricopeptide (TPR) repeat protein
LWKTIHPRWDMELLSFLYDSNTDLSVLEKRKRYLENALNSIFELGDQIVTTRVTAAIYDVAANRMVDMAIVESVFQIPNSLTDELKSLLYAAVIGPSYYDLQRYQEAIECYDKAPNSATTWYNKGLALTKLDRYEEAITSYDKATEIKPDYAKAWSNKGIAFANLARYEEAIGCFDAVLAIDPNNVAALETKGFIFYHLNQYEKALEYYDKALSLEPNDPKTWNHKGSVLDKVGRRDEAQNCFDKAKQLELKNDL